jgi:tRNA-dihydrouridine synthase
MESGVSGVLVGRGVLRNPWLLAQARDLTEGRTPREVSMRERGQFLLDYMTLLLEERTGEATGFRHVAPGTEDAAPSPATGRQRWVINKLRALCAWYSKGLEGGSLLRVRINAAESLPQVRDIIDEFFLSALTPAAR